MTFINGIITRIYDLVLGPFRDHAAWAMVLVAAVTGVWALYLFKVATPQQRLARQRDRLLGHIYEMGMYQDHLGVLARIQKDLALANLRYLSLTLSALVVLSVPMVLTLAQLEGRFAHRPLAVGETGVLAVEFGRGANLADVALDLPAGVSVVSGPVSEKATGTIVWKLQADKKGDLPLVISLAGETVGTATMHLGGGLPLLGYRNGRLWWEKLLYPGGDPVPAASPVRMITLDYPARRTSYLGVELNWLVAFIVFSMLGGLALKDFLGVEL